MLYCIHLWTLELPNSSNFSLYYVKYLKNDRVFNPIYFSSTSYFKHRLFVIFRGGGGVYVENYCTVFNTINICYLIMYYIMYM